MHRASAMALVLTLAGAAAALAQDRPPEHVTLPTTQPAPLPGLAPGLKATELSPNARTFRITLSQGDDVIAGLTEFAEKNHLTSGSFTAIGAFGSATIALTDASGPQRTFKAVRLNEEMELASFTGNITPGRDGKPMVHAHCVVATLKDGTLYAGHFVGGRVSLTMQITLVDQPPLAAAPPAR